MVIFDLFGTYLVLKLIGNICKNEVLRLDYITCRICYTVVLTSDYIHTASVAWPQPLQPQPRWRLLV